MQNLIVPIVVGVGLAGVFIFMGVSILMHNRSKQNVVKQDPTRLQHVTTVKQPEPKSVEQFASTEYKPVMIPSPDLQPMDDGIRYTPVGADLYGAYPVEFDDEDPFLTDQSAMQQDDNAKEMMSSLTDLLARWKGRRTATPYGGRDTYRTAYDEITNELATFIAEWEKRYGS